GQAGSASVSRALPLTLDEAAEALGITPSDAANPARHVRDLIRRHGVPFTRCGRTVKLRPDQLQALAERMVECPSNFASTITDSGTSSEPSPAGKMASLILSLSAARPAPGTSRKPTPSKGRSRTRK